METNKKTQPVPAKNSTHSPHVEENFSSKMGIERWDLPCLFLSNATFLLNYSLWQELKDSKE